ncbi:hypothetical protein [Candidatus Similichlamydia epinepheli]|uniref:hypothetical protein n=1 Tax=Candidatus Similichlamydia epinepheli TaxID=1903953 RepID=UPI001300B54E|nr:hypothetical protein [Candidatus Similichlamydia epinepheli]
MIKFLRRLSTCDCSLLLFNLSSQLVVKPFKIYSGAVNSVVSRFFTLPIFKHFLECENNISNILQREGSDLESIDIIVSLKRVCPDIRVALIDVKRLLNRVVTGDRQLDKQSYCRSMQVSINELTRLKNKLGKSFHSDMEELLFELAKSESPSDCQKCIQLVDSFFEKLARKIDTESSFVDVVKSCPLSVNRYWRKLLTTSSDAANDTIDRGALSGGLSDVLREVNNCCLHMQLLKEEFSARFSGKIHPYLKKAIDSDRLFDRFLSSLNETRDNLICLNESLKDLSSPEAYLIFLLGTAITILLIYKCCFLPLFFMTVFIIFKIISSIFLRKKVISLLSENSKLERRDTCYDIRHAGALDHLKKVLEACMQMVFKKLEVILIGMLTAFLFLRK